MRMIHTDGTPVPAPRAHSSWTRREISTTAGRLTYQERLVIDGDGDTTFERRRARVGDRIVSVDEFERILALAAQRRAG